MEIRFEIPQMIKAHNPQPIVMNVKTREILEAKAGLVDVNKITQLPDTFSKKDPMGCQPIKFTGCYPPNGGSFYA